LGLEVKGIKSIDVPAAFGQVSSQYGGGGGSTSSYRGVIIVQQQQITPPPNTIELSAVVDVEFTLAPTPS
jgi:hypothetical protein